MRQESARPDALALCPVSPAALAASLVGTHTACAHLKQDRHLQNLCEQRFRRTLIEVVL